MTSTPWILAIDLGTSGSKTAISDIYGNIIDFEFRPVPVIHLPGGGAEQDPEAWWEAIMTTAGLLLDRNAKARDRVAAVCASTQWCGTVAVDKEGRHLMNAIIWMDMRGEDVVRRIVGGPLKVEGYDVFKLLRWIRITGGAPSLSGKDPAGHIPYIRETRPGIYSRTYKFLEPKDYINLRLTGRFAASFDSIACHWVTDNRRLDSIDYHPGLLKLLGIDREKLPELKRSIDVLGPLRQSVAGKLGLRKDVPVFMGTPDIQAAALGSGAVEDYSGHIYIGTSSWISTHVPFKKTDALHAIASLPCPMPHRYCVVNEQETAGACLTFLRDNILYHKDELLQDEHLPDVYKIFDRIAADVPAGSNGVIFTPWLNGERTPIENNSIRAGLYNLSLETTRGDIIRAFMEGVAFNQRWVLGYLEKFVKRRLDCLHLIGGGANSDLWCQIHADVLGRTIRQVADPIQTNARGTAFIAAVGMGKIRFEDIPRYTRFKGEYRPDPQNRKRYDRLFKEFLQIYKNNRKMYRRLNG